MIDPLAIKNRLWPDVQFYKEQEEIIYSVWENDETVVPAGNQLGKDFVSAFIALAYFLTRHPCRIVTTSAKEDHLRVLWGEINRFIDRCAYPLTVDRGGPLLVNYQNIKKVVKGSLCKISYVTGMVASQDRVAALQGHHASPDIPDGIPHTLFVGDESSSVPDNYYTMARTWAKRMLFIGNTWPCENFFKRAVKGKAGTGDRGGDIARPGGGFYRKIIHIKAEDSPNVRLGLAEEAAGKIPSNRVIVPGVKTYAEFKKDQATLDKHKQSVILNAEFYEGAELKLIPRDWLERSLEIGRRQQRNRPAKAIGIDSGQGRANTAMCAIDEDGVIELVARKTPDTNVIVGEAKAFMSKHRVPAKSVLFDHGGGGKEHSDRLKAEGYGVRSVGFGESLMLLPKRGLTLIEDKIENRVERFVYKNRRCEMYGQLREWLDPANGHDFGIPPEFYESFYEELEPIPLTYDGEGRLDLPPKDRPRGQEVNENKPTLTELIGHSPDCADALVLALHAMLHKAPRSVAGAAI